MDLEFLRPLVRPAETKILLLVMDGLGGLPMAPGGATELETARTPNLDLLAAQGICGLHVPVRNAITPGSGPSHLGLFGYDPIRYEVGRGVLSALGIDLNLTRQDVAARGNFGTIDEHGLVTDRRAGRISTAKNRELVDLLRTIELPGAHVLVETVKEHRFVLVLRGDHLAGEISDTDPQVTGAAPLDPQPLLAPDTETGLAAERTAGLVQQFVDRAREILESHEPANMVLLRGFSKLPDWPLFPDIWSLRAAAIAAYPMYRGAAKLVGMDAFHAGDTLEEEVEVLREHWRDYDFFFLHVKGADSAGEDGDFARKVAVIEDVDAIIPRILELGPDVMVVTGDHSTPSVLRAHSWHPVPVLLWARYCRADPVQRFGERACMAGGLGPRLPVADLMPLAMANAGRLIKFGA